MITLNTKEKILDLHFNENMSQRDIAKELQVSRNTIRKYIRQYIDISNEIKVTEDKVKKNILKDRLNDEPRYDVSSRSPSKLTSDIASLIDSMLEENKKKSSSLRHKNIMKKVDIFENLIEKGYDIGYTTVCNYIREKHEVKEAYIRQEYNKGSSVEFDWGDINLIIAGRHCEVSMGLFATCYGNYYSGKLYRNKKMENFLDVHNHAVIDMGGVHQEIIYDNLKTAVAKFTVNPNTKEATKDLSKISMYYGFRYRFCNARRGNEKGKVERGVEFVRRKIFSKKDAFESMEEAQSYFQSELAVLNERTCAGKDVSRVQSLNEEKPYLIPFTEPYDISSVEMLRVDKYSTVVYQTNRYSVPDYLVGKILKVRVLPEEIRIYNKDIEVAGHNRLYGSHEWKMDIMHYLRTIKKKPGALNASAAFHQVSAKLQQLYQLYYTGKNKEFIELLEIIGEKGCEEVMSLIDTLALKNKNLVTTSNIKNLMFRKKEDDVTENKVINEIEKASVSLVNDITRLFNLNA